MKRFLVLFATLAVLACQSLPVLAEGPHDMNCMDCHSTHKVKASYAIGVEPQAAENPSRTRVRPTAAEIDAICLGCHNESMGIKPVSLHASHPTGIKPTYTQVPAQLLWDNTFTCVSCHNPHPSNPNYMYLVVDTAGGANKGVFCAKCHPGQSDKATVGQASGASLNTDANEPPILKVGN